MRGREGREGDGREREEGVSEKEGEREGGREKERGGGTEGRERKERDLGDVGIARGVVSDEASDLLLDAVHPPPHEPVELCVQVLGSPTHRHTQ